MFAYVGSIQNLKDRKRRFWRPSSSFRLRSSFSYGTRTSSERGRGRPFFGATKARSHSRKISRRGPSVDRKNRLLTKKTVFALQTSLFKSRQGLSVVLSKVPSPVVLVSFGTSQKPRFLFSESSFSSRRSRFRKLCYIRFVHFWSCPTKSHISSMSFCVHQIYFRSWS